MATSSLLTFWVVALLLIVVPGPDWAFTLGTGLRGDPVGPAVAGLVLGYATLTAVVAAGVGALVAGSPAVLTGLSVAGGGYLVWLGARTVARPPVPGGSPGGPAGGGATVARGVGVSGLNPKGLLLFLAVLPQFADPADSWPVAAQLGLLGLVFTATCGAFYLGLGLLARAVLGARPARAVARVAGVAMVVLGVALAGEALVR